MTDREKMIDRLNNELEQAKNMKMALQGISTDAFFMWMGVESAINTVLEWYDEIAVDGKPVFRR